MSTNATEVDLAKRTVCLMIQFRSFGNHKKVDSNSLEILDQNGKRDSKVNKKRIHASKKLLESPELTAITSYFMAIKKYVWNEALPFEASIHLIPIPIVPKIEEQLKTFKKKLPALIDEMLEAYPKRCKEAAAALGSQYRQKDFLTKEQMKEQFGFTWRYISFGVPEKLKGISAAMFEAERAKAEKRMEEAVSEIRLVLRQAMLELIKGMGERLKMKDGKPVTFRKASVEKLLAFMNEFELRNVTDDAELRKVIEEAKGLLGGVDPAALRELGKVRDQVSKGVGGIMKKLETMVTKAGQRRVHLED